MIVKLSVLAFIAILALPPYAHEPNAAPSPRSPAAPEAPTVPALPALAREPDWPHDADRTVNGRAALPDPRAPSPAPTRQAKLPIGIGDKLKIGFYESIDAGSKGLDALSTFYQRMDLSGEYTVEQDGSISIPVLGQFQVDGRALDDIRADLAASFLTAIGRSANVDARIIDRSPVYVVGTVKNPGAYRYAPGMIVLQALALAGGLGRGGEGASGMIEGAREVERLRMATLKVQQLLARRARLEAEREEVPALSISAGRLSVSSTPDENAVTQSASVLRAASDRGRGAGPFWEAESEIMRAEQAKRQQIRKEIGLKIAAARSEVDLLKRKLDQFDVEKGLRSERLEAMERLKDRGVETSNTVLVLQTELADIEARRQDSLVNVVEAEGRLVEAEGDNTKLSLDTTATLAKDIEAVDRDLAEAREETMAARSLAAILDPDDMPNAQAPSYVILRQSKDGTKSFPAAETSLLTPGDVVKVSAGGMSAIDAR